MQTFKVGDKVKVLYAWNGFIPGDVLTVTLESDKMNNDKVVKVTDGKDEHWIYSRYLDLDDGIVGEGGGGGGELVAGCVYSAPEVTMEEVCEKFGREVKIKK